MKKFDAKVALCATVIIAAAGAAHADVVIGDFEGADVGEWGYWNGGFQTPLADDPTLEFSNEDATSGSTSIKASNMGYDQNLAYKANTLEERAAWLANDTMVFDVIFPEYSTDGFWEIFEIVINTSAGFNNVTASITNSDGNGNQVGWAPGGSGRRVVSFELDYSSQLALWGGADMGYLELVWSLNNDSVHNIAYIDNVRLVPAPGAAAALALSCGALAGRRRR